MPLSLEQYATYLDSRDTPWPAPPEIHKPKAKPYVVPVPGIRAVTWSVYGTLLAIEGGELYFQHPKNFIMEVALDKTVQEFNMWASMTRKPGPPGEYLRQMYTEALGKQATVTGGGVKDVEVAADKVWETIIKKLLQKDYRFDANFFGALNEFSAKVAYFFHSSLQTTVAYPGAAEALRHAAAVDATQALLADAQVFTTVQLQRGLAAQDPSADVAALFHPEISQLSYKRGFKKPSNRLFRKALDELHERGIQPDQVLHVGSRITHDVIPAKRLGMRTALFAGDSASLEATPDQFKNPASRPDVLLTELSQIAEVVRGP